MQRAVSQIQRDKILSWLANGWTPLKIAKRLRTTASAIKKTAGIS